MREGTYVYLWLIHVDVWQKPIKYCKAIILQLKIHVLKYINEYIKKKKNLEINMVDLMDMSKCTLGKPLLGPD